MCTLGWVHLAMYMFSSLISSRDGLPMNFFKSIICFLKIYYLFPKANCINERNSLIWLR